MIILLLTYSIHRRDWDNRIRSQPTLRSVVLIKNRDNIYESLLLLHLASCTIWWTDEGKVGGIFEFFLRRFAVLTVLALKKIGLCSELNSASIDVNITRGHRANIFSHLPTPRVLRDPHTLTLPLFCRSFFGYVWTTPQESRSFSVVAHGQIFLVASGSLWI